jgi:amino acid adenylation domain-containing protein
LLHELIERQAQRTPSATAVVSGDLHLSYEELDRRANRLARHLRWLGCGPESRVGVAIERSLELAIALVGILKAGAVYVPLDPDYPRERLAFMLGDFLGGERTPLLLSQERFAALCREAAAGQPLTLIRLDADWHAVGREHGESLPHELDPDNLAYVIYTSGSTGRPKGAMNIHKAIVNRLLWMQETYTLTGQDRVLQKTPLSFDVSVWEFFWPLMTGACLVMARPGGHKDAAYLVDEIERQGITTLHFVPSMLQVFLEEQGLARCRPVRQVMASGEALSWDLERKFFARLGTELHNLYGPTEAAVDVTYHACQPSEAGRGVPIGRPIANVEILLLDGNGAPAPLGVPGELHIGGVGLARGYMGRPQLTAEKFVPHPLASRAGERLYRTGDLARHLPDGEIEYLGRLDHQVKIRGFRIELGEVDAVLVQHPAVREALTEVREEGGEKRLVSYVVPRGEGFRREEVRSFLTVRLPEYMVPTLFATLDRMPLLPNGKVDRRALPAPEAPAPGTYVPPSNPVEEALVEIWKAALRVERIGRDDNFFELGGHSLLMLQVRRKLQERFRRDLSMVELFRYTTVGSMAQFLSSGQREETSFTDAADRRMELEQGKERLKQRFRQRSQEGQ